MKRWGRSFTGPFGPCIIVSAFLILLCIVAGTVLWKQSGEQKKSEDHSEEMLKVNEETDPFEFTTPLSKNGFKGAEWITVDKSTDSAPMFRGQFKLKNEIKSAKLYATAAGFYEAYINGKKISSTAFDPGRSEYDKRIMYQCYDVKKFLMEGDNTMGAILGKGWYLGARANYKVDRPAFLAKLVVEYEDGKKETIGTDGNWKYTTDGPILEDDIFDGETYDARKEIKGWSVNGFNDNDWKAVKTTDKKQLKLGELVPQISGQIKAMDRIKAVSVNKVEKDTYVYDFGQNLSGVVSLKVKGKTGTKITLRHAEMLSDKGTLYTTNLRSAKATDTYYLKGSKNGETYTPRFTCHGFRYMELTGLEEPTELKDVTALVLYSDMEDTGNITTSDASLNKLIENTYWSQRSNFLSTPTDCPQRDERMGWSGDAQIFCGAAAYNMDVRTFYEKYVDDLNDGQHEDGSYPDCAPTHHRKEYGFSGHNGWGDAAIIIPWTMYTRYGDRTSIDKYYDNMKGYIEYLVATSEDYLRRSEVYGDWLSIGEKTDVGLTDTAYCVYVSDIMSKIAKIKGNSVDEEFFKETAKQFRKAWLEEFDGEEGKLKEDTQSAYLMALAFDILPKEKRQDYADTLNKKIKDNGYRLKTGFLGCPLLLPVLCEFGHSDTAFALLQQEDYPSWKYPINQGATTIWERWNSYTKDRGFGNDAMNSFNHYAYGSVIEWLYSGMAGISWDEDAPGFKHFILKPVCGGDIENVKAEYRSVRGLIKSSWKAEDNKMTAYSCRVPPNTTATLYLPKGDGRKKIELKPGTYEYDLKNNNESTVLTTKVASIDEYGDIILSATKEDFEAAGFGSCDITAIGFKGRNHEYLAPLITKPGEMMWGKTYIDFSNDKIMITRKLRNFAEREKLKDCVGQQVDIILKEKKGYSYEKAWPELSDYEGHKEAYANFRNVTGGKLGKNALYRSVHPGLDFAGYEGRHTYADALAKGHKVNAFITLSHGKKEMKKRVDKKTAPYYRKVLDEGKVSAHFMDGDLSSEQNRKAIKKHLVYMSKHKGPYLIHCAQGKDRTGFMTCLCEALMGVDYDAIAEDYSKSFENFGKVTPYSWQDKYLESCVDDFIEEMCVGAETDTYLWEKILEKLKLRSPGYTPPEEMDLDECAYHYLKDTLEMKEEEIDALKQNLGQSY